MNAVARELLRRAISRLGHEGVAARLDLSPVALQRVMDEDEEIPDSMLLVLIDVVIEGNHNKH